MHLRLNASLDFIKGTMLMDNQARLIERSIPLLTEIKDRTAGVALEVWLNQTHGPGTPFFDEVAALLRTGIEEGWVANVELDGCRYRRSRICAPSEATEFFSITTVYMDTRGEERFRGQYHAHPYGEVNLVLPLTPYAQLAGPRGWSGAGWTSPEPGSHHYPEVRRGEVISLFYLPAGRISYDIRSAAEASAS